MDPFGPCTVAVATGERRQFGYDGASDEEAQNNNIFLSKSTDHHPKGVLNSDRSVLFHTVLRLTAVLLSAIVVHCHLARSDAVLLNAKVPLDKAFEGTEMQVAQEPQEPPPETYLCHRYLGSVNGLDETREEALYHHMAQFFEIHDIHAVPGSQEVP